MKFLNIAVITLLSLSMISCGKDEIIDDAHEVGLEGEWNMLSLIGGLAGFNCSYNEGDLIWTFSADGKLEIEDLTVTQDPLCGGGGLPASPSRDYSVLDTLGRRFLLLNGGDFGELIENGDALTIDQKFYPSGDVSDGFVMTFRKK